MKHIIYLAGRYSRLEQICQYREILINSGYIVFSRWLDGEHVVNGEILVTGDDGKIISERRDSTKVCSQSHSMREKFAKEDIEDVNSSTLIISFTEQPTFRFTRGGRHVEFGYALAKGKDVWIVGPRENIFHFLPNVLQFESFGQCFQYLEHLSRTY